MSEILKTPKDLLLPYQRKWVDDRSRFKIGIWSRQTGKSFSTAEEAVEDFRRAIALDPTLEEARGELRDLLETLGDWPGVLECLEGKMHGASRQDQQLQAAICTEAAEIAATHVGGDASLPWLERLRAIRSEDASVVARIAEVHRAAGRQEALLRALEDELALSPDTGRLCALELERAEILEEQIGAPERAIAALEAARAAEPGSQQALQRLERLYRQTRRPRK